MGQDELIAGLLARRASIFSYLWIPQLLVGVFLLLMADYMGRDHLHLIREGVATAGRVVDYEQEAFASSSGASRSTTNAFMPIVEFRLSGRVIRFKDWLGSSSTGSLPNSVTVLYDPANPSLAMIDRKVMNWVPWAPTGGIGLLLLCSAIRGLIGVWNRTRAHGDQEAPILSAHGSASRSKERSGARGER